MPGQISQTKGLWGKELWEIQVRWENGRWGKEIGGRAGRGSGVRGHPG